MSANVHIQYLSDNLWILNALQNSFLSDKLRNLQQIILETQTGVPTLSQIPKACRVDRKAVKNDQVLLFDSLVSIVYLNMASYKTIMKYGLFIKTYI